MELGADNLSSGSTMDNSSSASAPSVTDNQAQATTDVQESAPVQESQYQPFANGKERFKVDGKEEEWDWETAKKYASLGKTAYQRMQEAADIKKRANDAYSQLLTLAEKDPEGLIRALNSNYTPQSQRAPQAQTGQDNVTNQQHDPRDQKIHGLENELQQIKQGLEMQAVEKERLAIQQEITEAESKYSVLKGNKFAINYIKNEYRKALANNVDTSIEDIAFLVSQELLEFNKAATQEKQKRFEQKRKSAPVNVVTASSEQGQKPMSLDDVKKLAGRI